MIDLRSDTVTRPTTAMREAMAHAEVGDDVYEEDPTVRRLEERTAALVGTEAALYLPSGTMANQIALLLHCRPGDEVVVGRGSHCIEYEGAAGAAWAGVQLRTVGEGPFTAADVAAAIRRPDVHHPPTTLVVVENTHNVSGGRVFPRDELGRIVSLCAERGIALHLDGARLWNAAVACGCSERELTDGFQSVGVCFSKGLGAPVGSALCASRATIARARRYRKMLGGGMRQVGIIAAGALYALEHHRARLSDDHAFARMLAEGLAAVPGLRVRPPETNMLLVELPVPAAHAVAIGRRHGVLFGMLGPAQLRLVTHLDVGGSDADRVSAVVVGALREACRGS